LCLLYLRFAFLCFTSFLLFPCPFQWHLYILRNHFVAELHQVHHCFILD
jgi:hypothetical protein